AQHVIVVTQDYAVLGVNGLPLIAVDIQRVACPVKFLDRRIFWGCCVVFKPVMLDRQEDSTERVGMGHRGCRGMDGRFFGSVFLGSLGSWIRPVMICQSVVSGVRPEGVPGGPVLLLLKPLKEVARIGVRD